MAMHKISYRAAKNKKAPKVCYLQGLQIKKPRMDRLKSIRGGYCSIKKLKHRMNASKTKKEASEIKVFLNQKIAHDNPFLEYFFL
jgi:hypothetical protein